MYQKNGTVPVYALILAMGILLLAVGCSNDGALSSIVGSTTSEVEQIWITEDSPLQGDTGDQPPPLEPKNLPPTIDMISCSNNCPAPGELISLDVVASDPNNDELEFCYETSFGCVTATGCNACWTLPSEEGTYKVLVTVTDGTHKDVRTFEIEVLEHHNLRNDL